MIADELSIPNTKLMDKSYHLLVYRESYLPLYLPKIIEKLKNSILIEIQDDINHWWFENNGIPVPWQYPCGVTYDMLSNGLMLKREVSDTHLEMWTLTLCYGKRYPDGIIPILNGLSQINDYWRHQWKQACFVLNGSAKRIMSLSIPDFKIFWQSTLSRDYKNYEEVKNKIVCLKRVKALPVRLYNDNGTFLQPNIPLVTTKMELSTFLENSGVTITEELVVIAQGIAVPLEIDIVALYNIFASIDGFLYIILR